MNVLAALAGRSAGPLLAGAAALGLFFYVSTLRDQVSEGRDLVAAAEERAAGALEAAGLLRRQAAALEASRASLREELRADEDRIRSVSGKCLDTAVPAELLD